MANELKECGFCLKLVDPYDRKNTVEYFNEKDVLIGYVHKKCLENNRWSVPGIKPELIENQN